MRENISVVIPTYNGLSLLEKHLPDVQAILTRGDEVIIVDDAGTDNTPSWVTENAPIWKKNGLELKIIRHEKNQRFAAAVNTGVAAARNPYVFLLNNDVSPLNAKTIELFLRWFTQKDVFAVGCAEITEKSPQARISGRGTGDWKRGLSVHWYDANQDLSNTLWTSGGSMFFDRQKFNTLHGMDILFAPAYEEDRDLSYRALKHGWHVYFDPEIVVYHQHESTNSSVFGSRKMNDMSWKNQYLFVWKNISDPALLISHFLWLPYHLTISAYRSKGSALRGFLLALLQLHEAMKSRNESAKLWKLTDREVFENAKILMNSPFSLKK